jgi:hypothetical protein
LRQLNPNYPLQTQERRKPPPDGSPKDPPPGPAPLDDSPKSQPRPCPRDAIHQSRPENPPHRQVEGPRLCERPSKGCPFASGALQVQHLGTSQEAAWMLWDRRKTSPSLEPLRHDPVGNGEVVKEDRKTFPTDGDSQEPPRASPPQDSSPEPLPTTRANESSYGGREGDPFSHPNRMAQVNRLMKSRRAFKENHPGKMVMGDVQAFLQLNPTLPREELSFP